MTPKSLFNIILKVLGIFFIDDLLIAIPQFAANFFYLPQGGAHQDAVWAIVMSFLTFFVYGWVAWMLIFRSSWIIRKLQLDSGFDQEMIPLKMHRSSILSISVIVVGGLLVVDEIPIFCRQLVAYFQERNLTSGQTRPSIGYVVLALAKVTVGILMMTQQKHVVNFIELRRKK